MNFIRKEIDKYLEQYRAADKATQLAKREETLYQFNKWRVIKEELRRIIMEGP